MATYDHLPLKRLEGSLERRKNGFGGSPGRDAGAHGARIEAEIDETLASQSALPAIDGIDPSLILKVTAAANIPEDEWRKLGLVLLSTDGDNSVVLFASDQSLQEFKRRVEAYQGELPLGQKLPMYANLVAAIESVSLLNATDRIGAVLRNLGISSPDKFTDGTNYLLDIELHFPPDKDDAFLFLHRLESVIGKNAGTVLSTYTGEHLLLARVEGPGEAIREALTLPEVAKVDMPPNPDFAVEDLAELTIADVTAGSPPPPDGVVIGIIDTGVNFGHPLLVGAEVGSISLDPTGVTSDEKGHGTQVASIAAFGDIKARVELNDFSQQFRLASARVLNSNGQFLKSRTLPDLMNEAVRTLNASYGCRIFNVSLGDETRPYSGGKLDTWSASLDSLARELDVLIIVSAGNRNDLTSSFSDKIMGQYPKYLITNGSKIIEPAAAAIVLTVGSLTHSNGIDDGDADYVGVQPICAADEPSPFTRTGPGVRGMIKPDLADRGGTAVWDGPSQKVVTGSAKAAAGVWSFSHVPIERLFVSRSGTSLAAPAVAYKAALLLQKFPGASANLLRALLGLSASIPPAALARAGGITAKEMTTVLGHGVSNATHAALSDDSRVVLYAEDSIEIDHFAVYEVPIPAAFQTEPGTREIRVSLAFDPPSRHTRADYLGATMAWRLLRGSDLQQVHDRFRKWKKEEGDLPEFEKRFVCKTEPGSDLRGFGTLQVGTYTGKRDISAYGSRYFVAVWCSRRWAPATIVKQKFAIAVQLRHENVNTLYASVRQPVKV